jgi:hypothetical protein
MINWGALGLVGLVSLAVGVIVVVLVAIALVGLSARELAEGESNVSPDAPATATATATIDGTPPVGLATAPAMSAALGTVLAVVCLLAVAAIVIYGLSLIIFHH